MGGLKMQRIKFFRSLAIGGSMVAFAFAGPTFAQDNSGREKEQGTESQNGSELDEIIVTANRRSESLLKAPIAVTAITQDGLDSAGIKDVESLTTSVPNFKIGVQNQNIALSLRGISTNNLTALGNSSVAFYTNGVYVPRPSGASQLLYDVERIEVLRGPQGTLFGRNATAGAVNVITTAPKDTFEAFGDASVGNYGAFGARGVINTPIFSGLNVRISFVTEQNDGYQDTRGTTADNYYRADNYGIRASAAWEITPRLTWRPTFSYLRDTGTPPMLVPLAPDDGLGSRSRPVSAPGFEDKDLYDFSSRLEWRPTDSVTFTYLAGYGKENSFTQIARGGAAKNLTRWLQRTKNHSHEIVLNYNTERLKMVSGLYYFQEKPGGALTSSISPATELQFYYLQDPITITAKAVFGEATFDLTSNLRITGGLRYSSDKAKLPREPIFLCPIGSPVVEATAGCFFLADIGGPNNRNSWSKTNWKVAADIDLTESIMAFATISTGYKTGGLAANGAPQFGPENVTNYQLGLKGRAGALTFALDTFVMKYTDQQVSAVRPVPGAASQLVTANAAASTIKGIELEATWRASSNDRLQGYISFLDAKYDDFKDAVDGFVSPTALVDVSGNRMTRAPKWSGRMSYLRTFDFPNGGKLEPQISLYAQSAEYLREFNQPIDRQKGYAKLDATMRYTAPEDRWYSELFLFNATNVEVLNQVSTQAVGTLFASYNAPRTYGLRIGAKF